MPNWKEAFEQTLAKGGMLLGSANCRFCQIMHVGAFEAGDRCVGCVLWTDIKEAYPCHLFLSNCIDASERRAICRHVLATVKDFTDRDEIRARIAEMLDDDAREKFLGKAEPEPNPRYWVYEAHCSLIYGPKNQGNDLNQPDFKYLIIRGTSTIAALGDKDTAEKVAAFLNAEAK